MKRIRSYFTSPAKSNTDDVFEHAQIDLTFDLTFGFSVLYTLMLIGTANLRTTLVYDVVSYSSGVGIMISLFSLRQTASYFWAGFIFWLTGFYTSTSMVLLSEPGALSNLQFGVWHSFSMILAFSLLGKRWGAANALYMIVITLLIALNSLNDWNLFDIGLSRGADIENDPVPVVIPMVAMSYIMFQTIRTRKRAQGIMSKQKEKETQQRIEIEQKNLEIIDSINYAKRIQSAILPSDDMFGQHLSNAFVWYQPKDIVAGDFYWMEPITAGVLFAAADCTGHGVPGAMVSVVCNNGLNRSVREYGLTTPGRILDQCREIVMHEFETSHDVKDGMDIALCKLEGTKLSYAGAHNPLWIIRKGAEEVEEIKADKQPIGKFDRINAFQTHETTLNPGDSFYIFSDGIVDQFGGPRGKKFKAANLKKLLLSVQDQSMPDQRRSIQQAFESWRGSLEQLDDVCIIGVRI